ncbi:hypothetical protein BC938DRAFT_480036 [Jimgerdemannia flammicorona]|uniref:Uncharacterized protein n=1 Tax=Jimgerdemannia flammicorona TaxID=994334 RepID=A0A433QJI1_9FUNG|nr:hypothetical protein BC938DRAFT_480036 [Jimgerdemannia flammicorona]
MRQADERNNADHADNKSRRHHPPQTGTQSLPTKTSSTEEHVVYYNNSRTEDYPFQTRIYELTKYFLTNTSYRKCNRTRSLQRHYCIHTNLGSHFALSCIACSIYSSSTRSPTTHTFLRQPHLRQPHLRQPHLCQSHLRRPHAHPGPVTNRATRSDPALAARTACYVGL